MAISQIETQVEVGDIQLKAGSVAGNIGADVAFTAILGAHSDEVNNLYVDGSPGSQFRLVFEGPQSGDAGTALSLVQTAKANRDRVYIIVRLGVAETAQPTESCSLSTQPSAAANSGVAFTVQPVIQLVDANGDPVYWSGIAVTVAMGAGVGTLSGTTSVNTTADGIATFTNLAITGAGAGQTLVFSAANRNSVTSNSITVS